MRVELQEDLCSSVLVEFEGGLFRTHFSGGIEVRSRGLKVEYVGGWGGTISWSRGG
jgi:hypothetical protein